MLTVRIIKENGKHASRAEIVSLYASDTDYVPYLGTGRSTETGRYT